MHFEILDSQRLDLLRLVCKEIDLSHFYLAGGTSLSLQMKLRKSFDFDFFTQDSFNENALYHSIDELFPNEIQVINLNKGTCNLIIRGIQISFFEYPYVLIKQTIPAVPITELKLASVEDIAAMKMSAIGGRGAKKDFFDLFFILKNTQITSEKLVQYIRMKYGENYNFSYMLMGLDYFEDAENEILPEQYVDFDWNQAKKFFVKIKKEMINYSFSKFS